MTRKTVSTVWTVAGRFVVGPYARRGDLDSAQYNHTGILRSIEELLGLPPMNKFDAAARPMHSAFHTLPDLAGFAALSNTIALDTLNPAATALKRPAARQWPQPGSASRTRMPRLNGS
jgi:hypothetical protein